MSSPEKKKKPATKMELVPNRSFPDKSFPEKKTVTKKPSQMSSPEKKKKKPTTNPELIPNSSSSPEKKKPSPITIESLPDELMLSCIVHLSRLYYPILSLVSKRFRSLLASHELYEFRSLLNRKESCLYVLLQTSNGDTLWFNLCRNFNHNNILIPIAISQSPKVYDSVFVAVGSEIYSIGGTTKGSPTTSVSVLDCRSHLWRKAPSMRFKRLTPFASVVDGKIYVVGKGGKNRDSDYLEEMEVFDTSTQMWNTLASPDLEIYNDHFFIFETACIQGNLHLLSGKEQTVYDPKEDKWSLVDREMDGVWFWNQIYCEIEDVMYCYNIDKEELVWYDTKVKVWKSLKTLVGGLPKFPLNRGYPRAKLVDYGGKMAVFWDVFMDFSFEKKIWCAVIVLERRRGEGEDEIWGEVEWLSSVLTVSSSCEFLKALAVTV